MCGVSPAQAGGAEGKGPQAGRRAEQSLRCCGCPVVQAQRFTQAVVVSITGKTIRRISEGFVIKGDSPKPEITRCQGSALRSWAPVTAEGRSGMEAAPPPAGDTDAPALSSDNECTWVNSLVQGHENRDDRQQASPVLTRWACYGSPHRSQATGCLP